MDHHLLKIEAYMHAKGLHIGEQSALRILDFHRNESPVESVEIHGRDMNTGSPAMLVITRDELNSNVDMNGTQ